MANSAYSLLPLQNPNVISKQDISNLLTKLNSKLIDKIDEMFSGYPVNDAGEISKETYVNRFIMGPSDLGMLGLFMLLDKDKDGRLSMQDFCSITETAIEHMAPKSELEEKFKIMDQDQDGFVTFDDLINDLNNPMQ